MRFLSVAVCLAGCASGTRVAASGDGPVPPGADASEPDGHKATDGPSGPDGPTQIAAAPLLLSEVELATAGHEFIEIVNPTAQAVDLSNYYLSDNGNYFRLPGAGMVNLSTNDFIVKFPAGAMIPSHGVVTVATDTAASFMTAYGVAPSFSITDQTMTSVDANGPATLTDTGEIVVLFAWDGHAPLVTDVDMVIAGVPTSGNTLVNKSGVMLGGGAYKSDANTLPMQASAPAAGTSTKRIMLETGHETQAGTGNGPGGDDETSEQTTATWDATFTAPTPGQVPAALLP